jgi:hypothetical protein
MESSMGQKPPKTAWISNIRRHIYPQNPTETHLRKLKSHRVLQFDPGNLPGQEPDVASCLERIIEGRKEVD